MQIIQNMTNYHKFGNLSVVGQLFIPAAGTLVAEAPAAGTLVAEAPAAETPVAETPAAETPAAEAPAAETLAAEAPAAETPADTTDLRRACISCSSLSLLSSRCCTLASHCARLGCDGSAPPTSSCNSCASSKSVGAAGMDGPGIAVDGTLDWLRLPTGDGIIGGRPLAAGRPLDAVRPLATGRPLAAG